MPIIKPSYAERMARLRGKITLAGRTAHPREPLDGVARTSSQTTYTDSLHGKGVYIRQSPGGPVDDLPCCDDDMIIHIRPFGDDPLMMQLYFTLEGDDRITVSWGDGTPPEEYDSSSGPITHIYRDGTDYYIHINGTATAFGSSSNVGKNFIIGIVKWGNLRLQSLRYGLEDAIHLEYVPPTLPLSVTDTSSMFRGATIFNGDITEWDVSRVTDMKNMFEEAVAFNQDLSAWNTGAVTDMEDMFENATAFNGDVSTWDVSKVTDMHDMFKDATAFAGDLSAWNTGAVTRMDQMFQNATNFNSNINGWDVSKVTDMHEMFNGATSFNSSLSAWNVGNVTDMESMFNGATAFEGNGGLRGWNTGKVTTLFSTFANATNFNGDVSTWNTGAVTTMQGTFAYTDKFNCGYAVGLSITDESGIGNWNVSKVGTDPTQLAGHGFSNMFHDAVAFNNPIGRWDTNNVTDMSLMFAGAIRFNQPINTALNHWIVNKVTDMSYMFAGATIFNQPLGSWDPSSVTNMASMFAGAIAFDKAINSWNTANVTTMNSMFAGANSFNNDLGVGILGNPSWDVGNVRDMSYMFSGATSFDRYLNAWDTSLVTNMDHMFNNTPQFGATGDVDAYIANWNTSEVTNMRSMFQNSRFTGKVDGWNVSKVTDMSNMFYHGTPHGFNRNLSAWFVQNSTAVIRGMFYNTSMPNPDFGPPINRWPNFNGNLGAIGANLFAAA